MRKIVARMRLLSQEEGGRSHPLPSDAFGCPMFFENIPELSSHGYDCRILLSGIRKPVVPGDEVEEVGILFLSPEEVFAHLRSGARFTLWEGKTIAHGEVLRIE